MVEETPTKEPAQADSKATAKDTAKAKSTADLPQTTKTKSGNDSRPAGDNSASNQKLSSEALWQQINSKILVGLTLSSLDWFFLGVLIALPLLNLYGLVLIAIGRAEDFNIMAAFQSLLGSKSLSLAGFAGKGDSLATKFSFPWWVSVIFLMTYDLIVIVVWGSVLMVLLMTVICVASPGQCAGTGLKALVPGF